MKEAIILPGYVDDMPFSLGYKVKGGTTLHISGATAYPLYHSHPHIEEELQVSDSIKDQTQKVLDNIKLVVEAAGGTINDIVKTTIFNTRMDLQDEVNEVYNAFFAGHRPARSHIGVSELVGSKLMIEIEVIAVLNN
ncbi:RidA family protein [Paenibacillus beijingensis]|uniref:Translation initiation inhibitor n=1 Tax=Paenibacillus beijingensis TaxID=1126833 RepID=A0A0D5NJM7_9BACL|nr:RidA family protein [Paenibacillus beijingensis]AJY75187.1 translation initiation inhibitor [Paenibacillus beijingensis]